jgi:hypothetical protein
MTTSLPEQMRYIDMAGAAGAGGHIGKILLVTAYNP